MSDDNESDSTITIIPDGSVYITQTDGDGNVTVDGLEGSFDTSGFEVDIGTDYTHPDE